MPLAHYKSRIARRTLLYSVLSFVAIQAALLWWLETRRPDLVAPDFHGRLKLIRDRQREEPDRPLCLVMGSSRIDLGFVPENLPPLPCKGASPLVINCANNGMGPRMQWLHLRRLLQEGIRPKWLVLEVMPMVLCLEAERFIGRFMLLNEFNQLAQPTRQSRLLLAMAARRLEVFPATARSLVRPALNSILPEDSLTVRTGPRLPLGGPLRLRDDVPLEQKQKLAAAERANYGKCTASFSIHPGLDQALRETIALCRQEGIKVVLFLSPEGSAFTAAYPPGAQELVGQYCRRVATEMGVRVVDGRSWLDDEDFYDGHHALRRGAQKMTRRLGQEVLAPLFSESAAAVRAESRQARR